MAKHGTISRPAVEWLTVCGPAAYLTLLALAVLYLHPHPLPPVWWALLPMLALSLVGTFVFSRFVFAQVRRQQAAIVRQTEEIAETKEAMAVIRERQLIAHEVHDDLAQSLGYLHLKLAELQRQAATGVPANLEVVLADLKEVTRDAYEEARQAIFGLRSTVSSGAGLIPALTGYLDDWRRRTAIAVDFRQGSGDGVRLSPSAEVQVIGILREALTNVRKHAEAQRVLVSIELRGATVRVAVQDDGKGFDPHAVADGADRGFGIAMMRERAEAAGGTLTVDSRPGYGTRLEVALPAGGPGGEGS